MPGTEKVSVVLKTLRKLQMASNAVENAFVDLVAVVPASSINHEPVLRTHSNKSRIFTPNELSRALVHVLKDHAGVRSLRTCFYVTW